MYQINRMHIYNRKFIPDAFFLVQNRLKLSGFARSLVLVKEDFIYLATNMGLS
jgi:hypothetical protein